MNDYTKQMQKHTRKQKLRDARRKSQQRSQEKKPRIKKITPNNWDDWDDLDEMAINAYQPILSKGESERRRETEKAIQQNQTSRSSMVDRMSEKPTQESHTEESALVVEAGSGICRVFQNGEIILCDIRGNIKDAITGYVNPVAVGDRVLITKNGNERGVVEKVLPRSSVLARPYSPDQGRKLDDLSQIVAANIDRLLVVASWREPYIWPAMIDRYLIAAKRNQIEAVICINKVDLIQDQKEFEATIQPYKQLGYQVLLSSTVTEMGIPDIQTILEDSTTVLAGLSGVGKSSILMAVQPDLDLKVGNVSEHGLFTGQGRHTTTQSKLLILDYSSIVIDTPGVRTFGLAGIAPTDLASWYPEMVPFSGKCRFANCTHTNEPDCAVKSAVANGALSAIRYKNYTQIIEELSD